MEEFEIRPIKTASTFALIAFLLNVLIIYILYLAGVDEKSSLNYISYLPFVLLLFYCIQYHKKKELGGYISFMRAFGTGFRFVSLLAILMGIFMYVYLKWLNPAVFEEGLVQAGNQMSDEGLSEDKIETALNLARSWGPTIAALTSTFMYTLTGTILSIIIGAVVKNEKPMFAPVDEEN